MQLQAAQREKATAIKLYISNLKFYQVLKVKRIHENIYN